MTMEQNTFEWGMHRLGRWNGSEIWQLMKSGRGKDQIFGATAMTYIEEVAAQRGLSDIYKTDFEMFKEYDNLVTAGSKFIDWGHENEAGGVMNFQLLTGCEVEECGSIDHPTIPNFSASPDRIVTVKGEREILEVKCPMPKSFGKYKMEIHDAADLLSVKPEYFYQVQAEMCVTGLKIANLVFFCPFMKNPIHRIRIAADDAVWAEFDIRIRKAEELISTLWTE